ncbi:EF-P lysine aminoacylase EpmA [Methylovirgula sp. 4M-Z18]|uniref:EF-P lysine aminoacylase EpmA n=1 Tax=Methylovirgula sp. 4M-Z18 TaxID=2293567 RepID=UPI000E2FAB52|nr:EF-P lysine aminoacylase EpmA [Methylovirgula sp. 4M-Z18]RFB80152.1 EF-P lysine aminoacylase GenX [Methylovirgula sp. 4M-Z18]
MSAASPAWSRHVYADRRPFLKIRNRVQAHLRDWFNGQDFMEVETPILQVSPGNEAHLSAFSTLLIQPDGQRTLLYLHTSPEFACKKLLAAGEPRLFTFARCFRNRERTGRHHPEFTMLEWYRARETYETLMADCAALLRQAAEAAETTRFSYGSASCDPFLPPERLTLAEAFTRYAGIDLLANLPEAAGGLHAAAHDQGIRLAADDSWSDVFSRIVTEKVEPNLGHGRPTILCEYPAEEAALARRKSADPRVAERFELYVCGLELANGFGELTDAAEQRRRFEEEERVRQRVYGETYPIDDDFLAALAQMPDASGIALGFDRLAMLAAGARRIEDVLFLPVAG